jgi:hypothetical protein
MDKKEIALYVFRLALVAGIVYLASIDKDGWGWLVFILLCTF